MTSLTRALTVALSTLPALWPSSPPVRPTQIQVVQPLDFGELLLEDIGGSVALTERNEIRQVSGGVSAALRSTTQEARLQLFGPAKATFTLLVEPDQPVLLNDRGASIRIAEWIHLPEALHGRFNDQGEAEVRLGARLDIPAGTLPGRYSTPDIRLRLSVMEGSPQIVTERFTASCRLRPMLQISNLGPLDFGSIIPGSTLGTYRVDPDGSTASPGGSQVRQYKGVPTPATFMVTGTSGTDYCLELPKRVLLHGPGRDMEAHSFRADVPLPGVLPRGGFSFKVGASLTVPPDQRPGMYQGVFHVTVHYP